MLQRHFKLATAFCAAMATTIAGGGVAEAGSAGGGGTLARPNPNVEGAVEVERIGFNALQTGEGLAASGQVQYSVTRDGEIWFISHLRVDCMGFVDENTVYIGCTVLNDSEPQYIGTTAGFLVRDNGEGNDAPADERSRVFYTLDQGFDLGDCEFVLAAFKGGVFVPEDFLRPLDSGNYQVAP